MLSRMPAHGGRDSALPYTGRHAAACGSSVNHQDLYWQNRNVFRRRLSAGVRRVLWLVFTVMVILAAALFLRMR